MGAVHPPLLLPREAPPESVRLAGLAAIHRALAEERAERVTVRPDAGSRDNHTAEARFAARVTSDDGGTEVIATGKERIGAIEAQEILEHAAELLAEHVKDGSAK
ncbi:hypothetical protein [Actinacidiphila sp. bgisy160]|uniref:hypothetical protein n=1 Tax=Actinacidiphila sp. bgisy160 TaxID=3413796 RepID=UPI003D707814